jgi:hypothetical protein
MAELFRLWITQGLCLGNLLICPMSKDKINAILLFNNEQVKIEFYFTFEYILGNSERPSLSGFSF